MRGLIGATANPIYEEAREDQDSLLRGLFMTSWLVEDFLTVNDNFGGQSCLITSASSKTSIALAYCVKRRGALASIGLTSPGNIAFCESLGCYGPRYRLRRHRHARRRCARRDGRHGRQRLSAERGASPFRRQYETLLQIGATHYEEMGPTEGLPGAEPEFFFAPTHIQTRSAEIGAGALMQALGTDYAAFRADADHWLGIQRNYGPDAVEKTYQAVLAGDNSLTRPDHFPMATVRLSARIEHVQLPTAFTILEQFFGH